MRESDDEMGHLDLRTVLFNNLAGAAVCTVVVALVWRSSRGRFNGLAFLVADYVLQTSAMGLLAMRGDAADWFALVLANVLVMLGSILGLMGLERFVGKPRSPLPNFTLLALHTATFTGFVLTSTDVSIRGSIVSVGLLLVWAQCFWLMIVRVDRPLRDAARPVGIVFGLFCLITIARVLLLLRQREFPADHSPTGTLEALLLVCYGVLVVLLTVSLALMVNRRLMRVLQSEETKFATVFKSSPAAILTRFSDGAIVEANDGFCRLTGHAYPDVVARTTVQLRLYVEDDARAALVRDLKERGNLREREVRFRRKDGDPFTGIMSADVVEIAGEAFILATFTDISERKRMEEEILELSLRDPLTGLYNRRGFFTIAEQKLKEANRGLGRLELVYIDLNGLKAINDALGHAEGDRALADAANVLRMTFRESDIIARVGGDEFVIVSSAAEDAGIEACRERLFRNLAAFNRRGTRRYTLAMSWGSTAYDPAAPRPLDDLMTEADRRMYAHKRGAGAP